MNPTEISLHSPENVLAAVEIAMAAFTERVGRFHKPQAGVFVLGQGYLWSFAIDKQAGILGAMAIMEAWPMGTVTFLTFDSAQNASTVDSTFIERGVHGFLQSITQGRVIDDETKYPLLLGPFKFLTGQMSACAEQQARGHGNN